MLIKHLQITNKMQAICQLSEYNFSLYQNQFINSKITEIVVLLLLFIFIYAIDFQKINKLLLIA